MQRLEGVLKELLLHPPPDNYAAHRRLVGRVLQEVRACSGSVTDAVNLITASKAFNPTTHFTAWKIVVDVIITLSPHMSMRDGSRVIEALLVSTTQFEQAFWGKSIEACKVLKSALYDLLNARTGLVTLAYCLRVSRHFANVARTTRGTALGSLLDPSVAAYTTRVEIAVHSMSVKGWSQRVFVPVCDIDLQRRTLGWLRHDKKTSVAVKRMETWWMNLFRTLARISWGFHRLGRLKLTASGGKLLAEALADVVENMLRYDDVSGLSSQKEASDVILFISKHFPIGEGQDAVGVYKYQQRLGIERSLSSSLWMSITDQMSALHHCGLLQSHVFLKRMVIATDQVPLRNIKHTEAFVKLFGTIITYCDCLDKYVQAKEYEVLIEKLFVQTRTKDPARVHIIVSLQLLFDALWKDEASIPQMYKPIAIESKRVREEAVHALETTLKIIRGKETVQLLNAFSPLLIHLSYLLQQHTPILGKCIVDISSRHSPRTMNASLSSLYSLTTTELRGGPQSSNAPAAPPTGSPPTSTPLLERRPGTMVSGAGQMPVARDTPMQTPSSSTSCVKVEAMPSRPAGQSGMPPPSTSGKVEGKGDALNLSIFDELPRQVVVNSLHIKLKRKLYEELEAAVSGITKTPDSVPYACLFHLAREKDTREDDVLPEAMANALRAANAPAFDFPAVAIRKQPAPWGAFDMMVRCLLSAPHSLRSGALHHAIQCTESDAHLIALLTTVEVRLMAHLQRVGYLHQLLHDVLVAYQCRMIQEDQIAAHGGPSGVLDVEALTLRRECLEACESVVIRATLMLSEIVPLKEVEKREEYPYLKSRPGGATPVVLEPVAHLSKHLMKGLVYGQSLTRYLEVSYGSRRGRSNFSKEALLENVRCLYSLAKGFWMPTEVHLLPEEVEGLVSRQMTERLPGDVAHEYGNLLEGALDPSSNLMKGYISSEFRATKDVKDHCARGRIQHFISTSKLSDDQQRNEEEERVLKWYAAEEGGKAKSSYFLAAVWEALWVDSMDSSGEVRAGGIDGAMSDMLAFMIRRICLRFTFEQRAEAAFILTGHVVDTLAHTTKLCVDDATASNDADAVRVLLCPTLPVEGITISDEVAKKRRLLLQGAALFHVFAQFNFCSYEHALMAAFERLGDDFIQRAVAGTLIDELLHKSSVSKLPSISSFLSSHRSIQTRIESGPPSKSDLSLLRCATILDLGFEIAVKAIADEMQVEEASPTHFWEQEDFEQVDDFSMRIPPTDLVHTTAWKGLQNLFVRAAKCTKPLLACNPRPVLHCRSLLRRWLARRCQPNLLLHELAASYLQGVSSCSLDELNVNLPYLSCEPFPLFLSPPIIRLLNGEKKQVVEVQLNLDYLHQVTLQVLECLQRLKGGSEETGHFSNYTSSVMPSNRMAVVRWVFEGLEKEFGSYFAGRLALIQIEVMLHPAGVGRVTQGIVDQLVREETIAMRADGVMGVPDSYASAYNWLGLGSISCGKYMSKEVDAAAYLLSSLPTTYHCAFVDAIVKRVLEVCGKKKMGSPPSSLLAFPLSSQSTMSWYAFAMHGEVEDAPCLDLPPPLGVLLGLLLAFTDYTGSQGLKAIEEVVDAVMASTRRELKGATDEEVAASFFGAEFCFRCICPFLPSLNNGDTAATLVEAVLSHFILSLDEALTRTAVRGCEPSNSHVDITGWKRKRDGLNEERPTAGYEYRYQKHHHLRACLLPSERSLIAGIDLIFYAHESLSNDCGDIGRALIKSGLLKAIQEGGPAARRALRTISNLY